MLHSKRGAQTGGPRCRFVALTDACGVKELKSHTSTVLASILVRSPALRGLRKRRRGWSHDRHQTASRGAQPLARRSNAERQ